MKTGFSKHEEGFLSVSFNFDILYSHLFQMKKCYLLDIIRFVTVHYNTRVERNIKYKVWYFEYDFCASRLLYFTACTYYERTDWPSVTNGFEVLFWCFYSLLLKNPRIIQTCTHIKLTNQDSCLELLARRLCVFESLCSTILSGTWWLYWCFCGCTYSY